MQQLNINMTPEFEKDLKTYMKKCGVTQKSEAVRKAIHDAVEMINRSRHTDFRTWRGLALQQHLNLKTKFKSQDDLWK
ncbi:MAG: hypothetical protein IPJ69_12385 [Deltaproteobacteria bacterium]|nr:MAG: hypothetical protein IPJ69_12385 [Deltaproteobacteria bacterium]